MPVSSVVTCGHPSSRQSFGGRALRGSRHGFRTDEDTGLPRDQFDWAGLGEAASVFFAGAPSWRGGFMLGPVHAVKGATIKRRKTRVKTEKFDASAHELERPEDRGEVAARDAANEAGPAAELAHMLLDLLLRVVPVVEVVDD